MTVVAVDQENQEPILVLGTITIELCTCAT